MTRTTKLLLLTAALLALAACRPAAAAPTAPIPARPHALYIGDAFLPQTMVEIDGRTLAGKPDGRAIPPMTIAPGGAVGATTEHTAGRANPDPTKSWIVLHDLPAGTERGRFHPPVAGYVSGLSAGGSRLLFAPLELTTIYPPPVDWYVLDAADGSVIAHVRDEAEACFRQWALLDPAGERLYCAADPAAGDELIGPMRILAYDVAGPTAPAAELVLPDVRLGQTMVEGNEDFRQTLVEPALALAPDGRRLAVVDAESEAITLIDTADLTVERAFTPQRPSGLWDWLFGRPARAKGILSGVIRHATFSDDGRMLYVYRQVLTPPDEPRTAARGLAAIDLQQRRVTAEALVGYQIQWLLPAPDGTLYAFGTTADDLVPMEIREDTPSTLWRLDGRTLEVLAERPFEGYRGGRLVLGE